MAKQFQEEAELDPLSPNTLCTALYDFQGNGPGDLSFRAGEKLVIVEASKVMFWYVARNSMGLTGLVPVTFMEKVVESDAPPKSAPPIPVRSSHFSRQSSQPPMPLRNRSVSPLPPPIPTSSRPIPDYLQIKDDSSMPPSLPPPRPPRSSTLPRPSHRTIESPPTPWVTPPVSIPPAIDPPSIEDRLPMPLPHQLATPSPKQSSCVIQVGKYSTILAFREQSGWFKPTPDYVLSKKVNVTVQGFRGMTSGIYFFQHKFKRMKRYLGQSLNIHDDLVSLFVRLYEKKEDNLNNLERELRYSSPDANDWNISIFPFHPEQLCLELTKMIAAQRTLPPNGLNECLEFSSRQHFNLFCEWYTEYRLSLKASGRI